MELAEQAARRGLTPTLALLTDGRANIALDGQASRAMAADDALKVARGLRVAGIDSIVIDTGNRPEPQLRTLSEALDGTYLPLPRANAERLSDAVFGRVGLTGMRWPQDATAWPLAEHSRIVLSRPHRCTFRWPAMARFCC